MKAATKIAPQRLPERRFKQTNIPVDSWGQDHWSLLAYIECRAVDNNGEISFDHVRVNGKRHPAWTAGRRSGSDWNPVWGTRTKNATLAQHDDYDVADDLEAAGLVKNIGTGINPQFRLTLEGWRVVGILRQHKAAGKNFATFTYPHPKPPTLEEELAELQRRAAGACTCDGGGTKCGACVAERTLKRQIA